MSTCLLKTTFAKVKSVLVLGKRLTASNKRNGEWLPALLLDSTGRQDQVACFSPDQNAEAYNSCSLTWRNNFFVFGGFLNERKISRLSGTNLKVVGSLPFDHKRGACTNLAGKKVFLCFNDWILVNDGLDSTESDWKRCRWSREPLGTFEQASLANYDHRGTRISSSNGKVFE